MEFELFNNTGKRLGTVSLDEDIVGRKVNKALISQYMRVYTARQYPWMSKKKTRAEVRGGGRKPWRQKGTGRARHGSIRSPLWVGGGVIHGPKPHPKIGLSKKMKQSALKNALSARAKEGRIIVLDNLELKTPSTKDFSAVMSRLSISGKVLLILPSSNRNVYLSSRNLPDVQVVLAKEVNAYDVLNCESLIFIKGAIDVVESLLFKKVREGRKITAANVIHEKKSSGSIEDLGLSKRSTNALQKAGVVSVAKLKTMSREDLEALRGLGAKSAEEIMDKIRGSYGHK